MEIDLLSSSSETTLLDKLILGSRLPLPFYIFNPKFILFTKLIDRKIFQYSLSHFCGIISFYKKKDFSGNFQEDLLTSVNRMDYLIPNEYFIYLNIVLLEYDIEEEIYLDELLLRFYDLYVNDLTSSNRYLGLIVFLSIYSKHGDLYSCGINYFEMLRTIGLIERVKVY